MLPMMGPKSAAEELPALYRALLDRIAQIDAAGQRSVGYRIRAEATRVYSRAWDDQARLQLLDLMRQAGEPQAVRHGQIRSFRRRSTPVA